MNGTERTVRVMFRRVCKYMGVRTDSVELHLFTDETPNSLRFLDPTLGMAAGTWSGGEESGYSDDRLPWEPSSGAGSQVPPWRKGVIRLEKSTLDRPSDLVGTMAHELSHQRLASLGPVGLVGGGLPPRRRPRPDPIVGKTGPAGPG